MQPALRVSLIYVLLGATWIWGSEQLLQELDPPHETLLMLERAKGWLFVLVSGVLIAAIVRGDMRRLRQANHDLLAGHEQAIRVLVVALDARHQETRDHSQRVARMTVALARFSGIDDDEELRRIEFGSLLHDIGKLVISDAILTKPGPLDADEMEQIRQHPDVGRELLQQTDFLRPCIDIPYCHHERWDGLGYPRGLAGEDIPLSARLFAVVDVWDALIHPRVYKQAWSHEQVCSHLRASAGTQFDPDAVELFLDHYGELTASECESPLARPRRHGLPTQAA